MKSKAIVKMSVDVFMTVGMLFVSGYQFWGESAHEWAGAGLFVLFIIHHLLNLNWYKNLFQGKYTFVRIFQLMIDVLVLAVMLIQMYSGIVLSRYVFDFLPIETGLALARWLHILGAYWGIVLMSLHLGLHWSIILAIIRKKLNIKNMSKVLTSVWSGAGFWVAVYGLYVFIKRDFLTYMFLKSEFVFLDYSEPALFFYLDYVALIGLCIFIAHYVSKLCRRLWEVKEKER